MKRVLSLLLIGMVLANVAIALPRTSQAAAAPRRPFPQHVSYAPGSIRPSRFTQAQLDQHVRAFYDDWKQKFLVAAGTNPAGRAMYRVAFGIGSSATVSEGQGYGMMIVALMAGHDANAQALFDGLWYFSRNYPSGGDRRLMSWKIDNGQIVDGNSSAFDGDADIAYGLLLADAQWGSTGSVNYAAEARAVIDGILAATIGPSSRLPMLGDWVSPSGATHNQYTPRSSDFMPSHFRSYGRATGNTVWNEVVSRSQTAISGIQSNYSPTTGLLPDFMLCSTSISCRPASAGFLEGPNDGSYYYNAGRDPWRLGLDALLNNNATSRAQVQKLINWLASSTGSTATNIKAGYQLNGTPIGQYFTTFFAAPVGVGAMTDSSKQGFLDSIYGAVYNRHESYFEDTVTLVCLLVMTGNYWDPTTAPPATGTNLALNKPATASSIEASGLEPGKAVDGSTTTRWASAEGVDPQWIRVDLGTTVDVRRVVLNWEVAYARSYRVEISADGSTWTTLYSTTSGDGGTDDLTVNGRGRYLRVYGTQRGTIYGYSLWELQAYS
ncbi:MAG TPA: glycosyl hydrolase family 8 [Herpetosiphonaceae bacterium]